jgi:dihydroflavonol-4-reductase
MRVFLTGSTGFIGQALTQRLLRRGWSVTALVRKPESPRAQRLSRMGATLTTGDVTQRESMRAPMAGADIVVHNAGVYELGLNKAGAERMRAVNVGGTDNVLSLAAELNIPRTVHVSSVVAFGESGPEARDESFQRQAACSTAYEQSKRDGHELARGYQQRGLPLVIVCPHQVIGANDQSALGYFIRLYVNRIMPPAAWGVKAKIRYIALNDLAQGIALAAERGRAGETYFLSGEPQTLHDALDSWNKQPGGSKWRVWLTAPVAAVLVAPLEPLQRMLGLPAFFSRESVRGGSTNWNYSSEKAQRELGWSHGDAEAMWSGALQGEIELLAQRKHQNWIQRLKPLATIQQDPHAASAPSGMAEEVPGSLQG